MPIAHVIVIIFVMVVVVVVDDVTLKKRVIFLFDLFAFLHHFYEPYLYNIIVIVSSALVLIC